MEKYEFLDRRMIKWIATVAMFIDHLALGYYYNGLWAWDPLWYDLARGIGRIAFPLYILLFVESFEKTKSRKNFFLRLLIFALLSEIPYDAVVNNMLTASGLFDFTNQNILWLFVISTPMLLLMEKLEKKSESHLFPLVANLLVLYAFTFVAGGIRVDYRENGIIAVGILYLLRDRHLLQSLALLPLFYFERFTANGMVFLTCPLAFFFNSKKKVIMSTGEKYFFYFFYPLHLTVIAGILTLALK